MSRKIECKLLLGPDRWVIFFLILFFALTNVAKAATAADFDPLLDSQWRYTIGSSSTEFLLTFDQNAQYDSDWFLGVTDSNLDGSNPRSTRTYFGTSYIILLPIVEVPGYHWAYVFAVTGNSLAGTFGWVDPNGEYGVEPVPLNGTKVAPATPADFSADATKGPAPLTIAFTDESIVTAVSWVWNFGDGQTSTEANPTHEYPVPGIYTVSLTVETADTTTYSKTKRNYIVATAVDSTVPGLPAYQFDRVWPSLPQPWYFQSPRGMAVDGAGHVYVADAWNNQVVKLTVNGPYVLSIGTPGTRHRGQPVPGT